MRKKAIEFIGRKYFNEISNYFNIRKNEDMSGTMNSTLNKSDSLADPVGRETRYVIDIARMIDTARWLKPEYDIGSKLTVYDAQLAFKDFD